MVVARLRGLSSSSIWNQSSRTITYNSSIHLSQSRKFSHEPISQIKSTLDDSEMVQNLDLPCNSLLTSIHSSSPHTAHTAQLVLERGLEKLRKENEKNHEIYLELIHLCGKIQNTKTAMRVFALMENQGLKPTSIVLNAQISVHLSSGNMITSLGIFQTMQNSEDYKPSSRTYNLFISAFSNHGNSKAMLAWYEAKMASGFSADLDMYEALILGCIKLKRFKDADRFYEEMFPQIKPNASILNSMLMGLCKQKDLDKIRVFLKSVLDHKLEINVSMTEKIVGFYSELELVKELEWVLMVITERKTDFDFDFDVVSQIHNGLIRVYAKLDRLDDLEYCIGRMLKDGVCFRSHKDVEMVVCLYFRKNEYERLDVFLEFIKNSHKLSRSTYELLVAGYRRCGLYEKVDLVIKDFDTICEGKSTLL